MTTGPTVVPLSRLLVDGPATTIVAMHAGEAINLAWLLADVAYNAELLRQRRCKRGLLLTNDAYMGAVGLLALISAGAEVIVPPNHGPGSLAALSGSWDLVVCDGPRRDLASNFMLSRSRGERVPLSPLDPEARLSFFTSGSTGLPKRVEKRLRHLEQEAAAVEALIGPVVPRAATIVATVPHQHVYGLTFRILWPLATGRAFRSQTHALWEEVLPCLGPATALITSPAHLGRIDGIAPLAADKRPSLVLSAGAPLSDAAAVVAASVLGSAVTEIFGSTETGAIAWRRRDANDRGWRPLPGVEIASSPEGLLAVRAGHVPQAYETGADRISIEPDGALHFHGRVDAIVKVEATRVSLVEVERQLCRLDEVEEAAVILVGGSVEELAAVVVPSASGMRALACTDPFRFGRRLREALASAQPAAGLPRRWRFVERLPVDTLGKRRASDLAALFDRPDAAPMPQKPTMPEVRAVRAGTDGVELDLAVPEDLAYLEGHFPGLPIVPGVVLIDWVIELAARHLALPVEVAQTFAAKFRHVIRPGELVTLSLRYGVARRNLDFAYRNDSQPLATGTIDIAAAAGPAPPGSR
jgi:acyl-coenzyme A synthetase/AMP-(fatty) acid ligase/3-hydroxymyristoyl/3-hydroxydecanoyl-(acyl carrier protein) dehydratase